MDENIGGNLHDLGLGRVLTHETKSVIYKRKIDELDLIKSEHFCSVKDTVKRMKKQSTDWRKYLQITYSTKDLYTKCVKEFSRLNSKKTNSLIKNGQET